MAEPRPKSATTRVCAVCGSRFTDDARHVATDIHLEAMALDTVRDWAAMPVGSPESIAIARQIARLEVFWDDYRAWCAAMLLDPTSDDALLINRRISAVWIKAIAMIDFEERMAPGRRRIEIEIHGIGDIHKTLKKIEKALK